MNWDDLQAFRVVAEELSFTAAARRLRTSQPALSQRVQRLERRLGGKLLHRTTRSVAVTAMGAEVLAWIVDADTGWSMLLQRLSRGSGAGALPEGVVLAVATPVDRLVHELRLRHPGTRWSVRTVDDPGSVRSAVLTGDARVGVWHRCPGQDRSLDPDLLVETAVDHPLWVYLAERHPMAGAEHVDLPDLADHRWVAPPDPRLRTALTSLCAEFGGFVPDLVDVAAGGRTADDLVAGGLALDLASPLAPLTAGIVRRPVRRLPGGSVDAAVRTGDDRSVLDAVLHVQRVITALTATAVAPDYWAHVTARPAEHAPLLGAWARHTTESRRTAGPLDDRSGWSGPSVVVPRPRTPLER